MITPHKLFRSINQDPLIDAQSGDFLDMFAQSTFQNSTFYATAIRIVEKPVFQQTLCTFEYFLSNEDGNHFQD